VAGGHSSIPPLDGSAAASVAARLVAALDAQPLPAQLPAPVRDLLAAIGTTRTTRTTCIRTAGVRTGRPRAPPARYPPPSHACLHPPGVGFLRRRRPSEPQALIALIAGPAPFSPPPLPQPPPRPARAAGCSAWPPRRWRPPGCGGWWRRPTWRTTPPRRPRWWGKPMGWRKRSAETQSCGGKPGSPAWATNLPRRANKGRAAPAEPSRECMRAPGTHTRPAPQPPTPTRAGAHHGRRDGPHAGLCGERAAARRHGALRMDTRTEMERRGMTRHASAPRCESTSGCFPATRWTRSSTTWRVWRAGGVPGGSGCRLGRAA
jgi:hypothetical protein